MRSARALQEALNLRSTVAVLGFAVRTLGQMLEEGKLDELVAQQRSQSNRGGARRDDDRGGRRGEGRGEGGRSSRPDPFARPAKPQPPAPEPEPEPETSADADVEPASAEPEAQNTEEAAADAGPISETGA
ncbi:hypothetical protein SynMEDNS5_00836 [Synechococcus sp. MEDNS5]|nr:hypothetical protein SynMEDNS5_00836 [Synechococcus sp. MEDNS5]